MAAATIGIVPDPQNGSHIVIPPSDYRIPVWVITAVAILSLIGAHPTLFFHPNLYI